MLEITVVQYIPLGCMRSVSISVSAHNTWALSFRESLKKKKNVFYMLWGGKRHATATYSVIVERLYVVCVSEITKYTLECDYYVCTVCRIPRVCRRAAPNLGKVFLRPPNCFHDYKTSLLASRERHPILSSPKINYWRTLFPGQRQFFMQCLFPSLPYPSKSWWPSISPNFFPRAPPPVNRRKKCQLGG